MFAYADTWHARGRHVEVRFTDASLDLQGDGPRFADDLAALEDATSVCFARLSQVHGDVVHEVTAAVGPGPRDDVPTGDGLVTTTRTGPGSTGLMVRVADCVPVVLADATSGVLGVAHAGRDGTRRGVVGRTVARMREVGADDAIRAWVGPHVCGACYEVPAAMREEVAGVVGETWASTRTGTPALDLGAGVRAQLASAGVRVVTTTGRCTREDPALHSYRRDGRAAGRMAGLVWTR